MRARGSIWSPLSLLAAVGQFVVLGDDAQHRLGQADLLADAHAVVAVQLAQVALGRGELVARAGDAVGDVVEADVVEQGADAQDLAVGAVEASSLASIIDRMEQLRPWK
jgi:hypothetical protein